MVVRLGSHVGMSGKEMLLGSAKEAASYGANTFMIYTGAPQNTRRKDISEMNIPAGQAYMAEHDLAEIVVHAPYIINLGNTIAPEKFTFGVDFLKAEVQRAEALGALQMTLHPGAHVGAGADAAIASIAKGLNEVITSEQKISIAIETMAGKGTEVGRTFEEIAAILDKVAYNDKVSVTMDTCHIHDAGYNVREDFDGVLNQFDKIVGLDKLGVIHVNDSKNPQGAHKDRHENIGFGYIGYQALHDVVFHPQLENLTKIMETPYVGEDKKTAVAPYGAEIAMLKSGEFDRQFREKLVPGWQEGPLVTEL
ncbi:deoxyribonuclease IV [Periweissella fabalis]|uniref:Probable endonuclease 4 n=1 Tax=Periweissella fabalis TaxID=1070421 RepID=A0A7X6N0Y2_9LACO|nr:deoxyribonuclease IV [Periweissella fabalis]MCM0598949.1 deoxyribonuclease IV [Periweissella fabalis]NKZ23229.1 deoxyribonuclease IV [Periweissella fabalis]